MSNSKRNMILIILSSFISELADYIFDIGIIIYLYKSTKSTALISGVFISQLLPAFLILVIGRTIDIFDKKKLIILCKACRIILFFVLLVNRSTISIYIVSFLLSFILEYSSNIFNALMTDLFTKEELLNKSSIISTSNSVSMIAGPLLASVLTYKTSLNVTISINIVLCIVVTVLYCGLKVERTSYSDELTGIGEHYEKRNIVKIILQNRQVVCTIIFWSIFMFIIGLMGPLEIVMIEKVIHAPSDFYGIGNSVEGIGMLVASAALIGISKKMTPNRAVAFGLILSSVAYLVIGVSPDFYVYLIGAFFVGAAAALCPLGFKTAVQTYSNKNIVGRTFAISRFVVIIVRLIGVSVSGWIVLKCGIRRLYMLASIIMILSAVTFLLRRGKR